MTSPLSRSALEIWRSRNEIKDEEFGIAQITFEPPEEERMYCLFHRDDIYLPDGKRALDHPFFKNKPLDVIASVGQEVDISARLILKCVK